MPAHDASIYKVGTQPNRVYRIFLDRLGEVVTPREIFLAMDSTAPHTLVSAVSRQLPARFEMVRGSKVDESGTSVHGWRLMERDRVEVVKAPVPEPVASTGQERLFTYPMRFD